MTLPVVAQGTANSTLPTPSTAPVGYLQVPCPANSDTTVAVPFTRPAAYTGTVTAISGNTITLDSSANFVAGQFVYNPAGSPAVSDHFYVGIGPATASLTGTLSVAQNSNSVTGSGTAFTTQLTVGDRLTINDGAGPLTFNVAAIASDTSLTLDRAFADAAATLTTGLAATYDHSPSEGRWYMVVSNGANNVSVNLNGDTLSPVAVNTQVSIIPCWSLATLFPASAANASFLPSPSNLNLATEILIPNFSASGINLAAASNYYYIGSASNTGWRLYGDSPFTDHGTDPILPDGYFIVREPAGASGLALTCQGAVAMNKLATSLATSDTQQQDNALGLNRPAGATLNALGLSPADNSFRASPSSLSLTDELLVYDNTQIAINKAASWTYYYINNAPNVGWRLFGDSPTTDHGSDVIPAASALTLRKAPVTAGTPTPVWTNAPNY